MRKPQRADPTPAPEKEPASPPEQITGSEAEVPPSVALAAERARSALAAMKAHREAPASHGSRRQARREHRGGRRR